MVIVTETCTLHNQFTTLCNIHLKKTGWSALHFSAEGGNTATAQALIRAGSNVNLKDKVFKLLVITPLRGMLPILPEGA